MKKNSVTNADEPSMNKPSQKSFKPEIDSSGDEMDTTTKVKSGSCAAKYEDIGTDKIPNYPLTSALATSNEVTVQ